MRKFKRNAPVSRYDLRLVEALEDMRELLFMMLNAQIAGPDPSGNLTKLHERLERFVDRRMYDEEDQDSGSGTDAGGGATVRVAWPGADNV